MAKDYLRYTTDDFIADEFFQRWVKFPDRETTSFWNRWITEHPEKRDEIMKASAFLHHLSFHTEPPAEVDIEASLSRSLQIIEKKERRLKSRRRKHTLLRKSIWITGIAAVFFLLFILWESFSTRQVDVEITTSAKEIRAILLPDSTLITLNANSYLKYSSDIHEHDTREVWLRGEAFFNVKRSETDHKPHHFIVHSGELNVEVLGTSFNIKKRDNFYNVSLNTGNIKIRLNDDAGSTIFLHPGDFFQYSPKEKSLIKKKVNPELYSDWKDEKMVLDDATLSEIAALIQDIYGYKTIIKDKQLENDKISGTILLKDENTFFQAIALALDIDITKEDKELIFQSKTKTK